MTIFDHPIFTHIAPYFHVPPGRDNADLLGLPDQLIALALKVQTNCPACGQPVFPLRRRAQSARSRIAGTPVERRLFYAATCPSEKNPGCARTAAAKDHKSTFIRRLTRVSRASTANSGEGTNNS